MRKIAVLLLSPLLAACFLSVGYLPLASATSTFGVTSIGSIDWSVPAYQCLAVKCALSEDGSVSKLTAYLYTVAAANVKGAIYNSDGSTLLGTTQSVAAPQTIGWTDLPFSSNVDLTAGTYILVIKSDASTLDSRWDSSSGMAISKDTTQDSYTYASSYTASSVTNDYGMSIYATYTTGGATPTPTPTTTPTPTPSPTSNIAFVQGKNASLMASDNPHVLEVVLDSAPQAGNTLVASISTISVTDFTNVTSISNTANTWNKAISHAEILGGCWETSEIWYSQVTSTNATIKVIFDRELSEGESAEWYLMVYEFSPTLTLDKTAFNSGASATITTGTTTLTTDNNESLVGNILSQNLPEFSSYATGYTPTNFWQADTGTTCAYKISSQTEQAEYNCSIQGSKWFIGTIATFKVQEETEPSPSPSPSPTSTTEPIITQNAGLDIIIYIIMLIIPITLTVLGSKYYKGIGLIAALLAFIFAYVCFTTGNLILNTTYDQTAQAFIYTTYPMAFFSWVPLLLGFVALVVAAKK